MPDKNGQTSLWDKGASKALTRAGLICTRGKYNPVLQTSIFIKKLFKSIQNIFSEKLLLLLSSTSEHLKCNKLFLTAVEAKIPWKETHYAILRT